MIRIVNKTGKPEDTKIYGFDKKNNMHLIKDIISYQIDDTDPNDVTAIISFSNVQLDMVEMEEELDEIEPEENSEFSIDDFGDDKEEIENLKDFVGEIENIKYSEKALTDDEIKSEYESKDD